MPVSRTAANAFSRRDLLLALFQAAERYFYFLMHAQDFVDATPIVFTFEALDFGQAVFDLFQRAGSKWTRSA